jgi:hypothetical protein
VTVIPTPPLSCSIAFKEWAGVCDALGTGRQSLILRKGGVSEEAGEFRPEHSAFWLYPTYVHEAEQGLRTPSPEREVETPGVVSIETLVVVEWVGRVERVEQLTWLGPLHGWTEATVLGRFHYRAPGLWALVVRAYRLPVPYSIAITPAHLGCKTWVPLETPLQTAGLAPVLDDKESARRVGAIRARVETNDFPEPDRTEVDRG